MECESVSLLARESGARLEADLVDDAEADERGQSKADANG
jgi:hypothetical protein